MEINTTANRRLAQWRVTWLIEHSTSHQLLWCFDSLVLRNPPLRQAPNRYKPLKMTRQIYILLAILTVLTTFTVYGQTCVQTGLSRSYDFTTSIKRNKVGQFPDSCIITVTIDDKTSKNQINTFLICTNYLLGDRKSVV